MCFISGTGSVHLAHREYAAIWKDRPRRRASAAAPPPERKLLTWPPSPQDPGWAIVQPEGCPPPVDSHVPASRRRPVQGADRGERRTAKSLSARATGIALWTIPYSCPSIGRSPRTPTLKRSQRSAFGSL
jgi:hypothetical protein